MEKLKMHSPDLTKENVAKLAELFPNCVTEATDELGVLQQSIDFDQLRQELSNHVVDGPRERYRLDWPGKREALLAANAPIAKTLRPCREESRDFNVTKNLFIEGDNLDALKLLQETYLNKVNLIYIDPPYNTGSDLIYEDDFAESAANYLQSSHQINDDLRLVANLDTSGRFHSNWLSMIYPRLRLARHLLSNDGAIFISIDENELANLKRVCDEVFDGHNHACTFVVKSNPRGSQSNVFCSSVHEYILCYVKDADCQTGFGVRLSQEMVSEYNLVDERGAYRLVGLRLRGGAWRRSDRPLLFYPLYVDETSGFICLERPKNPHSQVLPIQPTTGEEGTWRWGKEKVAASHAELIAKKVLRNNQEVWDIFQKDYLNTSNGNKKLTKPKTILDEKEVNYQNGTNEIKELFGKAVFSFPKPVYLIEKLIEMTPSKDGIVMDFFCGSATSADAVMSFNSKHGSNFQFFMVQVPQTCEPGSVAQKAGYATIAEIAKERIRRAGTKLKEKTGDHDQNIDIGFRVLKVDTSNMRDVYYKPDAIKKEDLFDHVENIKQDRTPEDLLFQVLLDWGVDLSLPIAQENIDGKTVFFVDGNALAACFDTGITEDLVKKIATRKPLRVVFRDAGFSDDSVKINVEQIFKLLSPDTEVKAI